MNFAKKERRAVDFNSCGNGVSGLLKDKRVQLSDIILYSRLHIEPNPANLLNQIFPVIFHGPPPAVAVCPWIVDVANVVHQHTPEQDANWSRVKAERLCPLVSELEFHPNPVLVFRQAPFCRFVINANQDRAFLAAVVNCDSRPSVVKFFPNSVFAKSAHKFLTSGIIKHSVNIQDTGMIIKGHVQPGDVVALPLLEEPEKSVKISGPVLFEAPAALAGHVQTGPHTRIAVVQNGNAAKVKPFPVSVPAMAQLVPAAALHPQQLHPGLRVLLLPAYRQPIIENDIL
nr:hypothetical protein [uncultured Oscillibacter sp.]